MLRDRHTDEPNDKQTDRRSRGERLSNPEDTQTNGKRQTDRRPYGQKRLSNPEKVLRRPTGKRIKGLRDIDRKEAGKRRQVNGLRQEQSSLRARVCLHAFVYESVCVGCVCVDMRAACVHACVRARVCVCACMCVRMMEEGPYRTHICDRPVVRRQQILNDIKRPFCHGRERLREKERSERSDRERQRERETGKERQSREGTEKSE